MRILNWLFVGVAWVIWMVALSAFGSPRGAWSASEIVAVGAMTVALMVLVWVLLVQPRRSRRQS